MLGGREEFKTESIIFDRKEEKREMIKKSRNEGNKERKNGKVLLENIEIW